MPEFSSEFSSENWKVYRTRFLVQAKQLTQALSFTDPLGREHHGQPGDYLVEFSAGLLRIAPQAIFEDVYVLMEQDPTPCDGSVRVRSHVENSTYVA